MASYNLNDVLKKKNLNSQRQESGEMALDDVARVKVLSPTRQVIKRFLRNRLAVFGFISVLVLFIFCFFGPLLYPYGQKQVFYKYDTLNIKFGVATESKTFTGYVVDPSITVDTKANSYMTTNIKQLNSTGDTFFTQIADDGNAYTVERLGESVYTLSQRDAERVASFGETVIDYAIYDGVKRDFTFFGEETDGFSDSAQTQLKGTSGSFTYNGNTYTYKRTTGKNYAIKATVNGFIYDGEKLPSLFESEAEKVKDGQIFTFDGNSYFVASEGNSKVIYRVGEAKIAKVFSTFVIDLFDTSKKISDEFRANSLLTLYSSSSFYADGQKYTYDKTDEDVIRIFDSNNNEYGEFSNFIIRRNNGEDTISYEAKQDIARNIDEMFEDPTKTGTSFTTSLPQQTVDGMYEYDENGNVIYTPTEVRVVKTDKNCELWAYQITYVIDRFASPSISHILGTDGDGFDVFARVMYGGRVSLMVGFVVVFLELIIGIILGGLAGYYGGWVDNVIMRLVDIFYCLPSMPIMIILGGIMDAMRMNVYTRLFVMMAALGIMGWAGVARLVRGQILSFREQEFMIAAEATGIKVKDRIFRHLIPNVMPQLIVLATMGVGGTILTESTLSFLGLGVKHPLATWGTMINSVSSASAMAHYAYIWIPVGLLISFTVISFNFVGDGLRDAYDPKGKR